MKIRPVKYITGRKRGVFKTIYNATFHASSLYCIRIRIRIRIKEFDCDCHQTYRHRIKITKKVQ